MSNPQQVFSAAALPVDAFTYFWDLNTMLWVRGQQPILNAGSVIIPGNVTVTGTVSVSNMIPAVETGLAKDATILDAVGVHALAADLSTPPFIYLGEAAAGSAGGAAVWRIQRWDTTGPIVSEWASGVSTFTKVWDNRASYSYS